MLHTTGNAEKIFATGSVDLNVTLADVMLMTAKGKVAVFAVLKAHQRLTIATTLRA